MAGKRIRAFMALCVLVFVAVGMGAGEAAAAPPVKSNLQWNKCFQAEGPFQCATVQVPLDHDQPEPARSPSPSSDSRRPSRPADRLAVPQPGWARRLRRRPRPLRRADPSPPEVRARFDIVGFDPRGIVRSTRDAVLRQPETIDPYCTPFAFPTDAPGGRTSIAADRSPRSVRPWGGKIQDHMSTANVARDLDSPAPARGRKLKY